MTRAVGGFAATAVAVAVAAAMLIPRPVSTLPSVPNFSVPDLTPGQPVITKAATAGHVTVLAFWASWCESCRKELPGLVGALGAMAPSVQLIGIDTNDQRSDGIHLLETLHLGLKSGFDDSAAVASAFHLPGLPATVVLSSSGRVSARYLGPPPLGALRAQTVRAGHQP